jgi:FkbM family methyltransferase
MNNFDNIDLALVRQHSEFLAYRTIIEVLQSKCKIVFDVGAHRGDIALHIDTLLSPDVIHAFEPNPEVFGKLQDAVSKAKAKMILNNVGVGSENSMQTFYDLNQTGSSSFLTLNPSSPYTQGIGLVETSSYDVPVITLDSYCANMGVTSVDYLKIDVQGYEFNVLQGCNNLLSSGSIKVIQFELLVRNLYQGSTLPSKIFTLLENNDYRMLTLHSFWPATGARLFQCDAVFCHRSLLNE